MLCFEKSVSHRTSCEVNNYCLDAHVQSETLTELDSKVRLSQDGIDFFWLGSAVYRIGLPKEGLRGTVRGRGRGS